MVSKEHLLEVAKGFSSIPIYEIMMVENVDQELYGWDGTPLGFPDFDSMRSVGFYYNLDDAICAVENNVCDINETVYDAAFIIMRYEGLYTSCGIEERMFFRWDEENHKYYQTEEPDLFRHTAL